MGQTSDGIDKDRINELLRKYSPSELGRATSRMCPSFEGGSREFTSAYGAMHRMAQSRLLVKLQTELDGFRVWGETKGASGEKVDGTVTGCELSLNGKKVELRASNEVCDIAAVEVKTGSVDPLQAAAYAYKWTLPVLVVELKTGDVHLVDVETAVILLSQAAEHERGLEALVGSGRKIPDYYQCMDCENRDCEHHRGGSRRAGYGVIQEKSEVLGNVDRAVRKIISILQDVLRSEGYTPVPRDSKPEGRRDVCS